MKGTLFDRKNTSKVLKQKRKCLLIRPYRKKVKDKYITMLSFLVVLRHSVNE